MRLFLKLYLVKEFNEKPAIDNLVFTSFLWRYKNET